jgi:hypothetical protein
MKHGLAQQNRKVRNESKKDININMQDIYVRGGKVKCKVYPRTGHEGPVRERM